MPGGTDDQISDDYARWAAEQVARQHDECPNRAGEPCPRCSSDGCPMDRWARAYLAGATLPYPGG